MKLRDKNIRAYLCNELKKKASALRKNTIPEQDDTNGYRDAKLKKEVTMFKKEVTMFKKEDNSTKKNALR